jgi:hypothetical protein
MIVPLRHFFNQAVRKSQRGAAPASSRTIAAAFMNCRNSRMDRRSASRFPPLKALRETMVLPSAVQQFEGRSISPTASTREFAAACCARRSGVHREFIALLVRYFRVRRYYPD